MSGTKWRAYCMFWTCLRWKQDWYHAMFVCYFILSQDILDVDKFVSSSEQIWRNVALIYCSLCSEWVPSEWEFIQLIQISQISTSNPHDSLSIKILWKLCVCNKHIHHEDAFNFKPLLPGKNVLSIIFSPVKKSSHLKNHLQVKTVLNKHIGGF